MVWGISPELPRQRPRRADPRDASRRAASVDRSAGAGWCRRRSLRAFEHHGGILRVDSAVGTHPVRRRRRARRRAARRHRDHRVPSSSRRATRTARSSNGCAIRRPEPATSSGAGVRVPHPDGYESKIDAVVSRAPRLREPSTHRSAPTTIVAPSLAEIDRAHRLMLDGSVHPTPGLLVNVPSLLDPTMAAGDATRARGEPRGALHAVPAARWLAGVDRAAAMARAVRRSLRAGLPRLDQRLAGDDARRLRARLPPAGRSRHELRRRSAGRAPQPRTRS